jgi:hypothetical protein
VAEHLVRWDLDPTEPGDVTALDRRVLHAASRVDGTARPDYDGDARAFCALAAVVYPRPPRDHRRAVRFGRAPVCLPIWQRLLQRPDHLRHVALGLPEPAEQPSVPHGPPALSDDIVGGLS